MSQVHAYLAIADQDQKAARDIAEGTAHSRYCRGIHGVYHLACCI